MTNNLISNDKIKKKNQCHKEKVEGKKLKSTRANSTNPSPMTWDCDKKKIKLPKERPSKKPKLK
jgi:hypothetical protein